MSLPTKVGLGSLCAADSTVEVDLDGQAQHVRGDAPEVEQAFCDGFDSTFETA